MDRCFHFLINVDQCLNMSNFDMFFYKINNLCHVFTFLNKQAAFTPPEQNYIMISIFFRFAPLILSRTDTAPSNFSDVSVILMDSSA